MLISQRLFEICSGQKCGTEGQRVFQYPPTAFSAGDKNYLTLYGGIKIEQPIV
jgi:hypothetical protein